MYALQNINADFRQGLLATSVLLLSLDEYLRKV